MVSVKWMTKIFVTGDIIAFIMQAAGAKVYLLDNILPSY